jgi:CHASE3 domain sensor protein
MNLRRTMNMAVVVPVALLLLLALLLGWEVRELITHEGAVAHTEQVKARLFETQKLLIDQETGLRGYLLTHDERFLDPYKSGSATYPKATGELMQLVSDNPAQTKRLDDLNRSYQQWFARAEQARTTAAAHAPVTLPADQGIEILGRKKEMDGLRAITGAMNREEDRLDAIRRARLEAWTRSATVGAAVILVVFAFLMSTLLRRWLTKIDTTYATALQEAGEARRAAEAFAHEALAQSRDFEQRYLALVRERDALLERRT